MSTSPAVNPAINSTVPTSSPSTAASSSSSSSASSLTSATSGLADSNFSDFLQLLTTQLQNQDPTDPTNTDALTQEIASLSQVEQQISTNNDLQQLISLYSNSQIGNLASYVGMEVNATGNSIQLQNGQGVLAYNLPATASKATVTITNSAGATVYSASGPTAAGYNEVGWDGSTTAGGTAPDGTYTFAVTATDANGNAVAATTYTTGVVTSVNTTAGASSLQLGNLSVPFSSVAQLRAPSTLAGDVATGNPITQAASTAASALSSAIGSAANTVGNVVNAL